MANESLKYKHPLAEVFGHSIDDMSSRANFHRENKLCPYNNNEVVCTKDKKDNPLGVCSMFIKDSTTVICPIRFREDWVICQDAANFFFSKNTSWSILKEVRLKDKSGRSAGNIDLVLVGHDEHGYISNFGAVEIQAVYVSGNIRRPFESYMKNPSTNFDMNWQNENNYPRPDYLSSSRKRLIPQLMYKGRILNSWGKKQAVIIDKKFYETLPMNIDESGKEGNFCWLVYDHRAIGKNYSIRLYKRIIEEFGDSMNRIGTPNIGDMSDFIKTLEKKLKIQIQKLKDEHGVWSFSQFLEDQQQKLEDVRIANVKHQSPNEL